MVQHNKKCLVVNRMDPELNTFVICVHLASGIAIVFIIDNTVVVFSLLYGCVQ